MKLQTYIYIFIFSALSNTFSYSQLSHELTKSNLRDIILNQNSFQDNFEELNDKINLYGGSTKSDKKSPYIGALFSVIIPGTGEIYAKSYLKGIIFFAVEAGLWTFYAINENKGDNQTSKYQSFADQNWSVYQYAGWLKNAGFDSSNRIDLSAPPNVLLTQINGCEDQNRFSHKLPYYGTQQYYELIGKYHTFVAGWKDADLDSLNQNQYNYETYKSSMFISYSYDRQKANDYYDNASTSLYVMIFNHLLSAIDAVWSVSMFNKELKIKTGMQLKEYYSFYWKKKLIPVANLNVSF